MSAITQTPHRCPVCEGHGIVPHGFFRHPAGQGFSSTSCENEKCKPCDGTGILWSTITHVTASAPDQDRSEERT